MAAFLDRGMESQAGPENNRPAGITRTETNAEAQSFEETKLVEALRKGDEPAFALLVQRHYASMLSLARNYVSSRAVAEEVVQEAWLGVLKGLDQFEARSSLKTWIFRILINRAKTFMKREGRTLPFSSVGDRDDDPAEPSVDPARFHAADHPTWSHHWRTPPRAWGESPEERLLSTETQAIIRRAIDELPHSQRAVVTMRDIEGWEPKEVCVTLSISEANQRVLLHRARSKVRCALEQYLADRS
jgi:RNA polymerase sigma-70 factor, ECF subfamily